MKTAEEIVAWALDNISHAYARPTQYGTKYMLDKSIAFYHEVWAFAHGKKGKLAAAVFQSEGGHKQSPEVIIDTTQISFAEAEPVIARWKWIDENLGIKIEEIME
jgi:hypothetical protein